MYVLIFCFNNDLLIFYTQKLNNSCNFMDWLIELRIILAIFICNN